MKYRIVYDMFLNGKYLIREKKEISACDDEKARKKARNLVKKENANSMEGKRFKLVRLVRIDTPAMPEKTTKIPLS